VMRQYKTWFALTFFWAPLVVALLLNPGRNGSHLPSFGSVQLALLGLCGLLMVVYFLANVGVERFQAAFCKRDEASWSTVGQAWLALAVGLMAVWWSATTLLYR
jgi:hypothetical protein